MTLGGKLITARVHASRVSSSSLNSASPSSSNVFQSIANALAGYNPNPNLEGVGAGSEFDF